MAIAPEVGPARLAAEESETAEQLFESHSGWIYGYCLRILRSPEEAEDALQTTYLNACRGLNQGTRPNQGSAWLLRIAQNVCFTKLRSTDRRRNLERVEDVAILDATVAAPDHAPDDLVGLTDALLGMPEQQRKAILLREWKGLSYSEIATELGITQSAVETLIFRARRSLVAGLESPSKRTRLRSVHAFDLAGLLAAIKGFLAGASIKTVAALTVAAATTATVVATDPVGVLPDRQSRERTNVQAATLQAASRPDPEVRAPSVETPARPVADAGEPPQAPGDRGRDDGRPTNASANDEAKSKANGKGSGKNGHGKAQAPGQVKKAESDPGATGRGAAAGGRPDPPGRGERPAEGGPPPHAQAKAVGKNEQT